MKYQHEIIDQLRMIGRIQGVVSRAESLDQALKESLQAILELSSADYAVIWYADPEKGDVLHPYYWVGPLDITNRSHRAGEGVVGRVFERQEPERYLNYKTGDDEVTDADFAGLGIQSMIVVPLSNMHDNLGCIQFIVGTDGTGTHKTGSSAMTEEEADACEILATLVAMSIEENTKLAGEWKPGEVILTARDITREYKNGDMITKVLKGVNLDVYDGEFLVLLGESGCGKSTFLNIIGGMDTATSGEMTFLGKKMSAATQDELTKFRRDNIGFIFQSYNLMPNLNAKQNLDLIGELVDDPMDSLEALKLVGLEERANNYPSQLSGGQQQRVSIARALIKKPKMIFADEPTAALDYTTSIEVLKVMEENCKNGTTLLMVTHNEEITRMADRVVRMRDGRTWEVTVNRHPVHAEELVW